MSNKQEAIECVRNLAQKKQYTIVLNIGFAQVKASDMNILRKSCRDNSGHLTVVKNTLATIAVKDTWVENIQPSFKNNSALLFAEDAISIANSIQNNINNKIPIKVIDARMRDVDHISGIELFKYLQTIPKREILLMQTMLAIVQPVHSIRLVCESPMRILVHTLDSLIHVKEVTK